jgi:O-antigen ligase
MDWFRRHFTYENSVLALSFFLPIHEKLSTLLIFWVMSMLFIGLYRGTVEITWNRSLVILPIIFLAYVGSIYFFSEQFDLKWIELRASLIAFPIVFLGKKSLSSIALLKVFIAGCLIAYLICFGQAIYSALYYTESALIFEPLINPARGFFEAIVYEGNYFFGKHFSAFIQTAYFGFYLTLALAALLIYHTRFCKKNTAIAIAIVLVLGIVQTMSLAALGGLFVLAIILVSAFLKSIRLKSIIYLMLIGIFVVGSVTQPRLKILLNDLLAKEFKLDPNERYGVMLRLLSWNAAIEIIKDRPLFGVGVPNAQKRLNQYYEENEYVYPLRENLNAHNQFLQTSVEMGITGMLLLLWVFFVLFKKMKRVALKNQVFISCFAVQLWFNFMFEVFFTRYIGISVFCFFYCLCVTMDQKEEYDSTDQ